MQAHRFRRLVIVNSHGGNTALLQAYAQEWEQRYGIEIDTVNFWVSGFYTDAQKLLDTPLSWDIHAGELETSLMLHLYPNLVAREAITPEHDVLATLSDQHPGWSTHTLSPGNGTLGRPTQATAQKGALLFEYTCDTLCAVLNTLGDLPA